MFMVGSWADTRGGVDMSKSINYDDWPGHRSAMEARLLARQGFPRFADAQADQPVSLLPPLTSVSLNLQIDQLIRQVNQLRGQLAKVEAEDNQLRGILAKVEAEEPAQARAMVAAHRANGSG